MQGLRKIVFYSKPFLYMLLCAALLHVSSTHRRPWMTFFLYLGAILFAILAGQALHSRSQVLISVGIMLLALCITIPLTGASTAIIPIVPAFLLLTLVFVTASRHKPRIETHSPSKLNSVK